MPLGIGKGAIAHKASVRERMAMRPHGNRSALSVSLLFVGWAIGGISAQQSRNLTQQAIDRTR